MIYSGDTLPCTNLMNYAQNCRVLIHEATLQDGMEKDALMKKHTTVSQAIDIGVKCNVWRTILTHFSPRYQKVAELPEGIDDKKILIAFDHMRVSFSNLEWAHSITKLYRELLSNEDRVKEPEA
jgi:ribonuclease Z